MTETDRTPEPQVLDIHSLAVRAAELIEHQSALGRGEAAGEQGTGGSASAERDLAMQGKEEEYADQKRQFNALIVSRVQKEDVLVFGSDKLATTFQDAVGTGQLVVAVVSRPSTGNAGTIGPLDVLKAGTIQCVAGDAFGDIPSLHRTYYGWKGFRLIVFLGPPDTLTIGTLRQALPIWQSYLHVRGRLVFEMERGELGDGLDEPWDTTAKRYQEAAQEHGWSLTEVNGFWLGKDLNADAVSPAQIERCLSQTRQAASRMRSSNAHASEILNRNADVWQERLKQVPTFSWSRPRRALWNGLEGQARLWCTLRRG